MTLRPLTPLRYHHALAETLQALEPGLWNWFSSDSYGDDYAAAVRLELLRSTYRLPRSGHERLYALADDVAQRFEISAPITLYQAQDATALNASLVFVPDEVHIVLSGPIGEVLTEAELTALFGHELAHHMLVTTQGGIFRVAGELIENLARQGAPSHVQSALRLRRWTEIYADRGALAACGDLGVAVGCLVKVATGLRAVDPLAYLAQAEEAIGAGDASSRGLTHPEAFLRAVALKSWHDGESDARVSPLVEGPIELDTLDLLQQCALTDATRSLLGRVLAPAWMRTEATLAHARRYFPDAAFDAAEPAPPMTLPSGGASIAEYFAYVLLDAGLADPELEEDSLAHVAKIAGELDLRSVFSPVVRKELRRTATAYAELEARGCARTEQP